MIEMKTDREEILNEWADKSSTLKICKNNDNNYKSREEKKPNQIQIQIHINQKSNLKLLT